MNEFVMNGYLWHLEFVKKGSVKLVDRTGIITLGTTDPAKRIIYLSEDLYGKMLFKVLIHELSHCAIISFGLNKKIYKLVKRKYVTEAEESLCNFLSDYGFYIFSKAYKILGTDAIYYIPKELEKFIA